MNNISLTTKKYVISMILILLGIIFIGFYLINLSLYSSFDYKIMSYIQKHNFFLFNSFILNFIKGITYIGNGVFYIISLPLVCFYYYYKGLKKEIVLIIGLILFSYILNESIKHIVCRVRPKEFFVIYMDGYSYPSGHAMNTSSFYLTFAYILKEKLNLKYFYFFSYIFILFVSLSRIVLGVHWVTDVAIGLFLGIFVHKFFVHLYNIYWRN